MIKKFFRAQDFREKSLVFHFEVRKKGQSLFFDVEMRKVAHDVVKVLLLEVVNFKNLAHHIVSLRSRPRLVKTWQTKNNLLILW